MSDDPCDRICQTIQMEFGDVPDFSSLIITCVASTRCMVLALSRSRRTNRTDCPAVAGFVQE